MQGDVQVPAGHAWCQARALSRARGKGGGEGGCEGGGEGAAAIGRGAAGGARAARLDAVLAAALPLPLAVRASTAHVALISCRLVMGGGVCVAFSRDGVPEAV